MNMPPPGVIRDFRDHSEFFVPALCLALEINQPEPNPSLGRPPHRTRQMRMDESVQYRIVRETDEVREPTLRNSRTLELSKCRIPPEANTAQREHGTASRRDWARPKHRRPNERCRPRLSLQAVPVTREGEQRMKVALSEIAVERHVLLLAAFQIFR